MDHQWKDPVRREESRNVGEKDGINDPSRPLRTLGEGRDSALRGGLLLFYSRAEWQEHRWSCNCSIKVKEFPLSVVFIFYCRRHPGWSSHLLRVDLPGRKDAG